MAFFRPALIICCAALAASSGVHAVSFGKVSPSATLGQPLNVLIPIRLDQDERMYAECVKAEVFSGDSPLLPSQVRVVVLPTANPAEWNARVSTAVPIEEPVIEVSVSAGCEHRFTRRFTALADPPLLALSEPVAAPSIPMPLALPLIASPEGPALQSERRLRTANAGQPAPRTKRSVVRQRPVPDDLAPVVALSPKASARPAAVPAALPRNDQVARLLLDVGSGPHLKMDMEEPIFMPPGSAASASTSEGSTELAQLQALEKSLRELRNESQSKQASELSLKAKLSEAEFKGRMLPWLVGLLLLATGVAIWLALRLRGVAGKADKTVASTWWGGQPGGAVGPVPEPPSSDASELLDLPQPASARVAAGRAAPVQEEGPLFAEISAADTQTDFDAYQTQPLVGVMAGAAARAEPMGMNAIVDGNSPAREVSVEELLDLEQQADFFIALGQEDAAGDLLMSHLRSTGGLSPLPYTKLLEIYRRQGDRSAYERIRARFNRRFNVYAPDWDVGPSHGRMLEDYPEVIAQLQELWPSHLNAMAVLEAMLFRNDERQDLFDLPAYKDVLLLYSLARDLYQQEGVSAADVDLLLPLGEHSVHVREPLPVAQRASAYDMTTFSLDMPEGGMVTGGPNAKPAK